MDYRYSTLVKSLLPPLVLQQRTRGYAALILPRSCNITRTRESRRRRSFRKHAHPPRASKDPGLDKRVDGAASRWKEFYTRARALGNKKSHLRRSCRKHGHPSQASKNPGLDKRVDDASRWKEFYTRARALRNKDCRDSLDLSKISRATIEDTFQKIDKVEDYHFPEDGDPPLDAACAALSDALQNATQADVKHDTPEVKQALDNLRKAYDDAAKSNLVTVHYLDAEPPSEPDSPLVVQPLNRIILARSWMKELITQLHDRSLCRRVIVVGNQGAGKSVALVGYLLFYLNALGVRVILQSGTSGGRLGFAFDDDGVREVFGDDASRYCDGKPCYLFVSADFTQIYPRPDFGFCSSTIVVTSPDMESKPDLKNWKKQAQAGQFIVPPPSCLEVVYLLSRIEKYDSYLVYWIYREWARDIRRCRYDCRRATLHLHNGTLFEWYREKTLKIKSDAQQMRSGDLHLNLEYQLQISSDLVTLERSYGSTKEYDIVFTTARIAEIVAMYRKKRTGP